MATNSANRTNEEEFLFDLNSSPVNSNVEIEGSTPVIVTPSLEGTLSRNLNMDQNSEIESPLLEFEVDQLQEEDEDVSDTNSENSEASHVRKKKKILSNGERWKVYNALLTRSVNGKLKRDTTKDVSTLLSVPIQTVRRIWRRAKETAHGTSINVSHRRHNCGCKRVQVDLDRVAAVPLHERTTLASLATKLEMSQATLYRLVKRGVLRRHSNSIKPYLKEEHKRARLQFFMSMLEPNSLSHEPQFVAGQRSSRNREAGTLEIKPITSVKRETIKAYLIERVLPRIQEVWRREDIGNTIFIQQDNARTHVNPNDAEFQTAATQNGFDIRLVCQPSNSPDLNILDLGFFSAIQSLQHKTSPKTVEDLINAVHKSFDEYPTRKVDHVFLSSQLCMREIMKVGGSNKFKIPHINKAGLEKEGHLPKAITCDLVIVQNVVNMLALD